MTLNVPLAVELTTSRVQRHVTRDLRGLRFRTIANGGYASATFALDRDLGQDPDDIEYYAKVAVYDTRSSETMWAGWMENPGRSAGTDGQVYNLSAFGPSAHATDDIRALIYADRRLDPWTVGGASASPPYLRVDTRTDEDSTTVIQIQAPAGSTFLAGAAGLVVNSVLATAGLQLGRASCGWRSGFTNASNDARLGTSIGTGATTAVETDVMSASSGTLAGSRGGSNAIPASHDTVRLRFQRNGTNLAGGDTIWLEFTNPVVRQLLKNAAGADITSGYTLDTVLASEVFTDLVGRMLPLFDGANAVIATSSYPIEQLAYPDGVNARKVIDDLIGLEPTLRWGAWEPNYAGKYRVELSTWPTTVRYETDVTYGYDSDPGSDGLYNAALVRYKDPSGQIRTITRTSSVDDLTNAGVTRTIEVDLGDEVSSLANAQQAGDQALVEHQYPPNAGRVTISQKILDHGTGRSVDPHEIVPGNLILLRGVRGAIDALNPAVRDGVTTFKIQAMEYDAGGPAATLELDSWPRSGARDLALAQTTRSRRR
jgi:hypothetical protein